MFMLVSFSLNQTLKIVKKVKQNFFFTQKSCVTILCEPLHQSSLMWIKLFAFHTLWFISPLIQEPSRDNVCCSSMTFSVFLRLFPSNHCTLVESNELVVGLAQCQRVSSAASKLHPQSLRLAQMLLLTHSHGRQKEWPRFTSYKPCLGGFIKSDQHSPVFPGCFPVYRLFLAFFTLLSSQL